MMHAQRAWSEALEMTAERSDKLVVNRCSGQRPDLAQSPPALRRLRYCVPYRVPSDREDYGGLETCHARS